ncbi:hypothetical protein CVT26_005904, partial [Gymnopilus dilepis]
CNYRWPSVHSATFTSSLTLFRSKTDQGGNACHILINTFGQILSPWLSLRVLGGCCPHHAQQMTPSDSLNHYIEVNPPGCCTALDDYRLAVTQRATRWVRT